MKHVRWKAFKEEMNQHYESHFECSNHVCRTYQLMLVKTSHLDLSFHERCDKRVIFSTYLPCIYILYACANTFVLCSHYECEPEETRFAALESIKKRSGILDDCLQNIFFHNLVRKISYVPCFPTFLSCDSLIVTSLHMICNRLCLYSGTFSLYLSNKC